MTDPEVHDCSKILDELYAFHDNELTEAEADHIRQHLLACEPCLDEFVVEEAFRTLIRKSCNCEAIATEELKIRVRATIIETTVVERTD